jgi:hypothetical protein
MSENRGSSTGQPAETDIAMLIALLENELEDMTGEIEGRISGLLLYPLLVVPHQ